MMKSHFHPFPMADVLFSCHFFCSTLVTHCLILSDSSNKPFPSIMWQFILSKLVRSPTHFYHVSTDVSESLNPYWHTVRGAGLGRKTWTCAIAFFYFIPQGQLSFQISMLWAAHLGSLLFCLCTWSCDTRFSETDFQFATDSLYSPTLAFTWFDHLSIFHSKFQTQWEALAVCRKQKNHWDCKGVIYF